jgi:flavin-dependent dehydrogenase
MGCLEGLAGPAPLPITTSRAYFGPKLAYCGPIPYYENAHGLPAHGYIIPRHELDTRLLDCAGAASARVFQGCAATAAVREDGFVQLSVRQGGRERVLRARLIVGADGAQSLIARAFGQRRDDRRYTGLSQRAYVEGVEIDGGEATIWFDDDLYPGYGWMFPMPGGRANVGVGLLSETCHRFGLSTPRAFTAFLHKLRIGHPGCARMELASKPLGGVVRMYGGVGPNHFDGGLLIGDAGAFVDPMTGEGITQGMESALIASRTVLAALEAGRFEAAQLASFERDFHAFFDPPMAWLDFCAAVLRNWHFREFWLRATLRGFGQAAADPAFGAVSGASFGGLNLRPLAIVEQIWARILAYVAGEAPRALADLVGGRGGPGLASDVLAWERGWRASLAHDPAWHSAWLADVAGKAARLAPALWAGPSPRLQGPLAQTSL